MPEILTFADPYTAVALAALGCIDKWLQLQILLPAEVRDKQNLEWQDFIDHCRKLVHAYVPPAPKVP
jgi:hypothetical protein